MPGVHATTSNEAEVVPVKGEELDLRELVGDYAASTAREASREMVWFYVSLC